MNVAYVFFYKVDVFFPSNQTKAASTNGVGSTNGHASTAPVSDISHLVRKKVTQLHVQIYSDVWTV